MTTSAMRLVAWMDSVPSTEFPSERHRTVFLQLRDRFAAREDVHEDLRDLYRVNHFSDFALSLMWLVDQPADASISEEEGAETLQKFVSALGVGAAASAFAAVPEEATEPETAPEQPVGESQAGGADVPEEVSLTSFAMHFEGFVEAMQAGDEKRTSMVGQIRTQAASLQTQPDNENIGVAQFCALLIDFLGYISEEGLMDDVRVMNIFSNISGDAATWLEPGVERRKESMNEAIGILKNFRSLFE